MINERAECVRTVVRNIKRVMWSEQLKESLRVISASLTASLPVPGMNSPPLVLYGLPQLLTPAMTILDVFYFLGRNTHLRVQGCNRLDVPNLQMTRLNPVSRFSPAPRYFFPC